jgi:site-specific recombinase XerD
MQEVTQEKVGVPVTWEQIEGFLDSMAAKGRVPATINGYRCKMRRLYQDLPEEDKSIHRDTLLAWREKLLQAGYSINGTNQFIVTANGYLDYMGAREFQVPEKLKIPKKVPPELTRSEYLRLLSTAKILGDERTYLLVKVFGNSDLPVQKLPDLTVEAAKVGQLSVNYKYSSEIIRFPEVVCRELLDYAKRQGILTGPIILDRDNSPMGRSNVTHRIRQLCQAAQVPVEKGNPRYLRKLYHVTRSGIERNIAMLVDQAQDRMLEEEQLSVGWGT